MNPPWYGTDKLRFYDQPFQDLANDLFQRVQALVGARAIVEEGSYSVEITNPTPTLDIGAKIVIYQAGINRGDHWHPGADGVYVLLRTLGNNATHGDTVALFQPTIEDRRFAFFRLQQTQGLDEMARFMVACCDF